jgi:hypothetical protein
MILFPGKEISPYDEGTKDGIYKYFHIMKIFKHYQVIVSPSASCALFVKQQQEFNHLPDQKIMELLQFLVEYDLLDQMTVTFPKKVGVLQSCHGLHLGKSSELMEGGEPTITSSDEGSLIAGCNYPIDGGFVHLNNYDLKNILV